MRVKNDKYQVWIRVDNKMKAPSHFPLCWLRLSRFSLVFICIWASPGFLFLAQPLNSNLFSQETGKEKLLQRILNFFGGSFFCWLHLPASGDVMMDFQCGLILHKLPQDDHLKDEWTNLSSDSKLHVEDSMQCLSRATWNDTDHVGHIWIHLFYWRSVELKGLCSHYIMSLQ